MSFICGSGGCGQINLIKNYIMLNLTFLSEQQIKEYLQNNDLYQENGKIFYNGVKYSLLNICKSLFEQLTQDESIALHFCNECKQVVFYSDEDTCEDCYQNYKPSEDGEICPKCGSENYYSHCSNCDAELDCDYLSDILYYELSDIEWIDIDDLSTIKDYLLSVLDKRK